MIKDFETILELKLAAIESVAEELGMGINRGVGCDLLLSNDKFCIVVNAMNGAEITYEKYDLDADGEPLNEIGTATNFDKFIELIGQ